MKLAALFGGLLCIAVSVTAEQMPNILLIVIDDMNTSLGCFDGPAITPHIDRFSEGALKFTSAYSACPSCNPSRVSMLTGVRPEVSKVFSNSQHFRKTEEAKDLVTLPQFLKNNGYNTVVAGKIFHGRLKKENDPESDSDPRSWTYQPVVDFGDYYGKNFYDEFLDSDWVPEWVGRANPDMPLAERKKIKEAWAFGPTDVSPENTLDFNSARFCADFLTGNKSNPQVALAPDVEEKPFFLACGIFRPHIPIIAPREFFDLYTNEEEKWRLELPKIPDDEMADLPASVQKKKQWFMTHVQHSPDIWKELRHAYFAATSYADAAVGIVLDGLAKSTYADNTVVIIIGDHGYQLGEKNRVGKSVNWKGSSGTPMIVKVPGKPAGATDVPVSLIDIYPTIMELSNMDPPHQLSGVSLLPLLENPNAKRSEPVVITNAGSGKDISVVKDHWHYISYGDGSEELYDHRKDSKEWKNLLAKGIRNPEYDSIVNKLKPFIPKERGLPEGYTYERRSYMTKEWEGHRETTSNKRAAN
ncbi:sulfatase [Pontiella sulfatireligans]|uniref:Choline-sulfatase n=1 Tax=Pontiella sulfatireligans TaxID=2750658 RepID=A0A6C2UD18_9BACT|nr:sulfatase [Pontiella sulfatireligans]SPS74132.1 sulfatase S1_7 [Kiritimatiellales bacterium]VGO18092.1 Choline-sulfatase [Pontiella sulfatireligans]